MARLGWGMTISGPGISGNILDMSVTTNRGEVDITHLASADKMREYLDGFKDVTISLTVDDDGSGLPVKQAPGSYTLKFQDDPNAATPLATWTFNGFVTSAESTFTPDDRITTRLTIRVNGNITIT